MNRLERRKKQTENTIIQSAVELFTQKGYAQTTMEEIAAKADFAKGTLYNYFPDKETILITYYQHMVSEQFIPLQESLLQITAVEERLNQILDSLLDSIFKNKLLANNYLLIRASSTSQGLSAGSSEILRIIFEDAQKKGEIRQDYPPELLVHNFQFLFRGYVTESLREGTLEQFKQEKKKWVALYLNGAKVKEVSSNAS